jgi:hypothetical protein
MKTKHSKPTYYLYLKKHKKTGLKYLGKTIQDPHTYSGSGKEWTAHLAQYGNNVETIVLFETFDFKKFNQVARRF